MPKLKMIENYCKNGNKKRLYLLNTLAQEFRRVYYNKQKMSRYLNKLFEII